MLPTKFRFIWPSGFREEFFKSANQKQESPVVFTNKTDLLDITETLVENCLQHTNPN
jgi:hypothetical protein